MSSKPQSHHHITCLQSRTLETSDAKALYLVEVITQALGLYIEFPLHVVVCSRVVDEARHALGGKLKFTHACDTIKIYSKYTKKRKDPTFRQKLSNRHVTLQQ